jgi:biopolymer transport protein ExbD
MSRFKSVDVEENVACNLIPMIDIMFLLLLFFMLSADMTQRVAEDITLPIADKVKEDPKQKEGYETTTVNLVTENGAWFVKIAGTAYPDWGHLRATLDDLAKASPEPGNAAGGFFSSRAIMLRAEADAPYKEVQRLIQLCSAVGLYKIEVVAAKPAPDAKKA